LDFSAIANQESLSILEVEMRKLETVVREIVDEMGYLQRREMKMRDTNGQSDGERSADRGYASPADHAQKVRMPGSRHSPF
jgi:hypothetical protein